MTSSGHVRSTVVLTVDAPSVWQGSPSMPGGLVPPFVPSDTIIEGALSVVVKG